METEAAVVRFPVDLPETVYRQLRDRAEQARKPGERASVKAVILQMIQRELATEAKG